ncbi:hypothetical protein [Paeniglutamicibacter terrestris]|uniref:Uncharacterized protein n=1 Tax=Paeniglutamicibacter terrestris TaxID=2723403 RepID=A0ABX1G4E1_9MICC|nr:hypothetical protein [Paeniglutamicibacter terrestris]NKG21112.1 hypothetical protein [Paeniglutamicibacter terrestris]
MDLTVQYYDSCIHAGEWSLPVRLDAFDDPRLLILMSDISLGGRLRLLWFLLEPECHDDLRSLMRAATGTSSSQNVMAFTRVILEQEARGLMIFLHMLATCRAELKADFRRFYSLGLDAALVELSPRDLSDYAVSLPSEGAVHRKLNPDHEWSLNEQLMAAMIDVQNMRRYEAAKLAGANSATKPKQIERPGVSNGETENIGESEGFENVEDFDEAYAKIRARFAPAPE